MPKFKYTTIFSSTVKPLVAKEKDEFLAMASLIDIGEFLPDIDIEKHYDLLPIAFNAAVVNRANKNGDVIDTPTALTIYKSFINKPINIEHNRGRIIGTILTAGFSEFGTDKPLTEEEVARMNDPFNITLGGVVWKIANSELADIIEDSADPTSENYMKISASWELGFTDYKLAVVVGEERNIRNAEIITDESRLEILRDHLKALGGSGKLDDGRYVYRQVIGEVVPLGIGLTESPAADVAGVVVKPEENEQEEPEENLKHKPSKEMEEKSSKKINKTKQRVVMKITSLKDINDENLQEMQASDIASFVEEELQKVSEKFAADQTALEDARKEAKEQYESLTVESNSTKEELGKVIAELDELKAERAAKEAEEKFNHRMSSMDEEYDLSDEDREVIASDVKDMSDEDFETYATKMAILLSSKNKKALEEEAKKNTDAEEAKAEEAKPEALEKVEKPKEEQATAKTEVSEVVEEVVDEAVLEEDAIANSTSATEATVYDKYRNAFGIDQFIINT